MVGFGASLPARPQAGPSRPPRQTNTTAPHINPAAFTPTPPAPLPTAYTYPYQYPHYAYQQQVYAYGYPSQSYGQSLFNPAAQTFAYNGYAYQQAEPPAKKARTSEAAPAYSDPSAWRNCSVAGCKFVGAGHDVEIHEGDRHLIFPRGKPVERSEEEEMYANHKGYVAF